MNAFIWFLVGFGFCRSVQSEGSLLNIYNIFKENEQVLVAQVAIAKEKKSK